MLERYFYEDMLGPDGAGRPEYLVFDRSKGCTRGKALVATHDVDVAQRVVRLLNADEESRKPVVYEMKEVRL